MSYLPHVIDGITNATRTITYPHHEIHGGSAYNLWVTSGALASGSSINLCFTTENTANRWVHMLVKAVGSVSTEVFVYEGSTVTAATGTNLAAINMNRNSSNTSAIISTNDGTVGSGTYNATIGGAPTTIYSQRFGGKGASGGTRGDSELLLAENTTYAFVLTSRAANNVVSLNLEWYEHTNL